MIDLDKMTLEEVLAYCEEREKWILNLFVRCIFRPLRALCTEV